MLANGFAKPVVVEIEWLANQQENEHMVVAEVDENPDLYVKATSPVRSSFTGVPTFRTRSSETFSRRWSSSA